jgi:hypothetical protein
MQDQKIFHCTEALARVDEEIGVGVEQCNETRTDAMVLLQ